jgi:hypothetical protein
MYVISHRRCTQDAVAVSLCGLRENRYKNINIYICDKRMDRHRRRSGLG